MPAVATVAAEKKVPELPEERFPQLFTARRFVLPDFDRYGLWLLARIKETFEGVPESRALSWLRGVTNSNEHLFITNEKAVMLCDLERSYLSTVPTVREVFCFAQDGALDHGASLYADMKRWAVGMSARQMNLMRASDVPQPMIEEVLGMKVKPWRTMFAKLS